MLALLVFAETATRLAVQSAVPATATVRIERVAALGRKNEWDKAPRLNRREIIRKEPDGRMVVVRVIEQE